MLFGVRRMIVRAQFLAGDGRLVCAELQALVKDCVRSLLSLTSLAAKGWSIVIESSGLRVSCLRGSCPQRRIRLYTYWCRNCGWLVSRSWRVTLVDGQPQLIGSLATSSTLSSTSLEDGRISARYPARAERRSGGGSRGDSSSSAGESRVKPTAEWEKGSACRRWQR